MPPLDVSNKPASEAIAYPHQPAHRPTLPADRDNRGMSAAHVAGQQMRGVSMHAEEWLPMQPQPPTSPRMMVPRSMLPGVAASVPLSPQQVRHASPQFGIRDAAVRYPSPQMPPRAVSPQGIFVGAPPQQVPVTVQWDHPRWAPAYPMDQGPGQHQHQPSHVSAPRPRAATPVKTMEQSRDGSTPASAQVRVPQASIGITCGRTDNRDFAGAVYILAIHPNGPAGKKGVLEPMQELISVDGWSVVGQSMDAITQRVVGPAGSIVSLEVADFPHFCFSSKCSPNVGADRRELATRLTPH